MFELRWERLAAVLLASMEVSDDVDMVLKKLAEADSGWVGRSAMFLLVSSRSRRGILDDLRRGLRPSSKLVEEASSVIKAVL